jgi:flagellar motor switch protein FliN/FliY
MPMGGAIEDWLIGEFVTRLGGVFEMMTGEAVAIACHPAAGEEPAGSGLTWHQPFAGVAGGVWLHAAAGDLAAIGSHVLRAAGVDDANADTLKSTYLETLSQAFSGLGLALSGKLKREVTPAGGEEREIDGAGMFPWWRAEITLPDGIASLSIGFDSALRDRVGVSEQPAIVAPTLPPAVPPKVADAATSRTFDILLDVEMPVSVSFGRAQVQLKDVLKLTTGSIVELNRSITEPVEVIVNNCVIARGEVVVVEGNFGVRIQHVISRQDRLRTLH